MHEVVVNIQGGHSYAVSVVGSLDASTSLSSDFASILARIHAKRSVSRIAVIVDSLLLPTVQPLLSAHTSLFLPVEGCESISKSRETKAMIEDHLLSLHCDKNSLLVAIGGGSIGDTVGFVAATFLRGIRFMHIPTTLLSMVDSSIGGKTAINTDNGGKNMIGAFHQPEAVLINTGFLSSLSRRHFINGLAEIVKAGIVGDDSTWRILQTATLADIGDIGGEALLSLVTSAIEYKRRVVEEDEKDCGIRNELNFGHTIGHALEFLPNSTMLHGECVSVGMVYELMCLRAVGHLDDPGIVAVVEEMLTKYGLPTVVPPHLLSAANFERFKTLLLQDKKASSVSTGVPIVALKRIGLTVGKSRTVSIPLDLLLRAVSPFIHVSPQSSLTGEPANVTVPGSKSVANRALLLAALSGRACVVTNVPASTDVRIMQNCLAALGFALAEQTRSDMVEFSGARSPVADASLFVGNSGTTARFLLPVAASLVAHSDTSHPTSASFTCDPRMCERPMHDLIEALRLVFPAIIFTFHGELNHFPLTITKSPKTPACEEGVSTVPMSGSVSSQFISGLLMTAPCLGRPLTVVVKGTLVSEPFVAMTIRLMEAFGGSVGCGRSDGVISYACDGEGYGGTANFAIPGDAASASYPFAYAALTRSSVTVNVGDDGLQSDYVFVDILAAMGCLVQKSALTTTVTGPAVLTTPLDGWAVDMNDCSDTFLTAAVVMAAAGLCCSITNIANQRVKECDRISAVALNLAKCGYNVTERADGLEFTPDHMESDMGRNAVVETYNDHRVAMAFAVLSAASRHSRRITIENPRCVEKTFPTFWDLPLWTGGLEGVPCESCDVTGITLFIGMRGIGKSTIGRAAAASLGYRFIDLDQLIEEREDFSVGDIIAERGWKEFRSAETRALKSVVYSHVRQLRTQAAGVKGVLVACGGGIVESSENRELLKRIESVVWVRGPSDAVDIDAAVAVSNGAPAYVDSAAATYARRKQWYLECSRMDLFVRACSVEDSIVGLANMLRRPLPSAEAGLPTEFVCLTAKSYSEWTHADFAAVIDSTAELVELRVDLVDDLDSFIHHYSSTAIKVGKPVILTLRTRAEGGNFNDTSQYIPVLKRLIRLNPDWIDVEMNSIGDSVEDKFFAQTKVGCRFIASAHYTRAPPQSSAALKHAVEAVASPAWASVGKLVYHAESPSDSSRLSLVAEESSGRFHKPIIALCTGSAGITSRVTNQTMTPLCTSARSRLAAAAPGQIDTYQLSLVRSGAIGLIPTRFMFYLFGAPVHKSPSPFIHNLMFACRGMAEACMYTALHAETLADVVPRIRLPTFRGASVTMPLKERVFEYLTGLNAEVSDDAKLAGSVNTLCVDRNGALSGHNTDIIALGEILLKRGQRGTCLVVGTGGAARGAVIAAAAIFHTIAVYGRDPVKVEAFINSISLSGSTSVVALNPASLNSAVDCVIGCIPSAGQEQFLSQHEDVINESTLIVEMAYIPRSTPLVQATIDRLGSDTNVVYGSEVLLLQGVAQHELWRKSLLDREEIPDTGLVSGTQIDVDFVRGRLLQFSK